MSNNPDNEPRTPRSSQDDRFNLWTSNSPLSDLPSDNSIVLHPRYFTSEEPNSPTRKKARDNRGRSIPQPKQQTFHYQYSGETIWIDVIPFSPPTSDTIASVLDMVRVRLPPLPEQYNTKALSTTKQLSAAEFSLPLKDRLRRIVFVPNLVDQLLGPIVEALRSLLFQWGMDKYQCFLYCIHNFVTCANLPPVIWSEKDVEQWAHASLLRPALHVVKALLRGDLLYEFPQDGTDIQYPYISSAPAFQVTPDAMLVTEGVRSDIEVGVSIEFKTPAAWSLSEKWPKEFKHIVNDLQLLLPDMPVGSAVLFNWPDLAIHNENTIESQARILCQLWTQLVYKKCGMGMATTEYDTIFYARGKGAESDTLFLSRTYIANDCPLLAVSSWFAVACGAISNDHLQLPKVDDTWYKSRLRGQEDEDLPGVIRRSGFAVMGYR
ncbi:hypothetical protein OBBRIDRAFT_875921 [Obba rivulosa]|uniref:Uncharacterized protein n=1 Tax=Obba rivulosa TaxID=1052685 RepID=A0A8E2AZ08_9APHY|nr:hypothetical protein OBBRIDRAFT_875921 [Obba rivulosa]